MYIYFDTNGTIKEVINDESIRRGSSDYNKIYCYLEGNPDIDDIWYLQKNPDGTLTNEVSFVDNVVTKAIPYDAKRDMKYFQDFEEYQFYVFTLSSSYLSQNGLVVATIRVAEDNTLWALGELTFNVQANIVNSDNDITQSQYDYLLLSYASRTLNEQTANDLYNTIEQLVITNIDVTPSVFDTSANILALTSNQGVAVATDTGYIYHWNGENSIYENTGLLYVGDINGYAKVDGSNVNNFTISGNLTSSGDISGENVEVENNTESKSYTMDGKHITTYMKEISKGNLYVTKMYGNLYLNVDGGTGNLIYDASVHNRYVDPNWYHLQIGDRICFNGNENYRYWLAVKTNLSDNSITDTGWLQEDYIATNECYVRISVSNADNSDFTTGFVELLDEDVVLIYTKKPITTRLGSIYNDKINSYLFYSSVDVFNNRLRTNVLQFKKGDIINFKEYGTEYAWAFMGWNFDGTLDLDTGWKTSNFYVVPKDYKAVIIFKKSNYAQSLLLKGNIYYQKGLDGTTNNSNCVIVLDNTCVKTGDTITITNGTNAIDFKVDFLNDQWGKGTTTLQTINYGTTSATVTADMNNVKNVVITIKKSDGTAFSNISSELLWYIYRSANITKSNGEYFDTEAIYDIDFEVNKDVEPTKFNSNLVQIGHRGWDDLAPENTIPSFDLAYKLGCRFLEGDIQFTSDGVPVLLHDTTLNRTARNSDGTSLSSTINIANITYAQALEYDFGIYQGNLYQGTKIPTFEEMIKWLKLHNDVFFQIDLTTGSWSNSQVLSLYKIVAKYGMFDNLIWESGSSATISYLISLGVKPKNTMVSYYSSITTANVDTAYNLGCKVFSIQYSLATYSLIQYVISKGMKPYIWFDSADKYAYNVYRLTNLGVVGFYNTNISNIYALRWFKTFVGTDGNTASSITDKDTALLKQASLGNIMQETTYSNTNPSKSKKVVLSKVGGMSYKSENLLQLNDVAETTINGITYSITDGVFSISGTATQRVEIRLMSYAFTVGAYSVKVFDIQNLGSINVRFFADAIMSYSNLTSTTLSNTFSLQTAVTSDFGFVVPSGANVNATFKYMLVSGSTAPTTFKPYFSGIRDSAVTSVVSKNSNNTTIDTLTIHSTIQNLTGYGWGISESICNYIDYDNKKFIQMVGRLKPKNYTFVGSNGFFQIAISSIKRPSSNATKAVLLSTNYEVDTAQNVYAGTNDQRVAVNADNGYLQIRDNNYTNATDFKNHFTDDDWIYYELATPIETDISSYITKDTLEVVEGGTIEFLNTYNQAVPNEVAYLFNAVTLNNVVDSYGNPRFIEGNGTPATITGFTATQCKWSLSGTHLMLVLAGTMANGTTLSNGNILAVFTLPDFILNKIIPSWANNYIERKANILFADNWTTQTGTVVLGKFSNIRIMQSGALTLTADRHFRIQFDLLIDSE